MSQRIFPTIFAATLACGMAAVAPNVSGAVPNSIIFNEGNTVSNSSFLEDDKRDPFFGRVEGNGNNWMEFTVVQGNDLGGGNFANTLDMRGWTIEWNYQKDDQPDQYGFGKLTLTNDAAWAKIPRGTLIGINEWKQLWYDNNTPATVDAFGGKLKAGGVNGFGEVRTAPYDPLNHTLVDLSTDLSWNPGTGDYSMRFWAGEKNPDNSFKYFNIEGTISEPDNDDPGFAAQVYQVGIDQPGGLFSVNNDDWRIVIKDASGNIVQGPLGEHLPPTNIGLNSTEILKLEAFPQGTNPTIADYLATTLADYNDGSSSTYGDANVWGSGAFIQDLDGLRNWLQYGDADLDGFVTGLDFNLWLERNGTGWGNGDFDGDGTIGGLDFNLWLDRPFVFPDGPSSLASFASGLSALPVPEPSTYMLIGVGMVTLCFRVQRRKSNS